jgi:glutathionylspermidine synthase
MQRIEGGSERPGWREIVRLEGLAYIDTVTPSGETVSYWREGQYYTFTAAEIDVIERAGKRLFEMFIEAGQYVIDHNLFTKFGIPDWAIPAIRELWKDPEDVGARVGWYTPMMYGRYDLCPILDDFGNLVSVKLYEYNADTPTGMVETAQTQWNWFSWHYQSPTTGQFNELYESLVAGWVHEIRKFRQHTGRGVSIVHFAYSRTEESGEDALNTGLMLEAARAASAQLVQEGDAGFELVGLFMDEIVRAVGVDEDNQPVDMAYFSDPNHKPIDVIFKLFPWEWMVYDEFGKSACENMLAFDGTVWLEPIWKMLWSNKAILAVLWGLYKDTDEAEYLLPAYFDGEQPNEFVNYVRKPMLGREGADLTIVVNNEPMEFGPEQGYGEEGYIVQGFHPLPGFSSELEPGTTYHPVLGLWTVQNDMVAMCLRESIGRVTDNQSFFVPHVITGLSPTDLD